MGIFGRRPDVEELVAKRDVEGLIKGLKHKDVEVCRKAAGALGRLGDPRAIDPLMRILTGDKEVMFDQDLYLLGDVAKALGEIGDEKAIKALESAARARHTSILSVSSLEEAASYAAQRKERINYFKEAVKEALRKIRAKRRKE